MQKNKRFWVCWGLYLLVLWMSFTERSTKYKFARMNDIGNFFLSPCFPSLNSTAVMKTTKQTDQAVNNPFIMIDILPRHSVGYAYASLSKSLNDATNKTHRCLNMTLAAPVMPDSSGLGKRTAPPLRVDMPQVGALRRRCLFVSPPITEPQWVVSNTGERQQTAS